MKLKYPNLIASLAGVVISFALINPILWLFDPIGLLTYKDDMNELFSYRTPTHEGYELPDGIYDMRGYTATIVGGNRVMPMVEGANCTIGFIGDSVPFGMGVDDEDTFVYQIAELFPDIQFVNMGKPAYNATNNMRTIKQSNADGFIVIHNGNDDIPLTQFEAVQSRNRSAISYYAYYYMIRWSETRSDMEAYNVAMDTMMARNDVLIVGFGDDPLLNNANVARISMWTSNVSIADPHPDANGHDEITANLLPIVEPFVNEICN